MRIKNVFPFAYNGVCRRMVVFPHGFFRQNQEIPEGRASSIKVFNSTHVAFITKEDVTENG